MINWKHYSLLAITIIVIASVMTLPAIPQDQSYHSFADQRTIFGIANFFNVISNIPYLIFGLMGCHLLHKDKSLHLVAAVKNAYVLFFVGVSLVCFGSGYYHLSPSNDTLLWDRLPMTLAFMPFFCLILAEFVHEKAAQRLLYPLLITGLVSVLYWYWSESIGEGDLRLYALVQFLPMILIPVILLLFSSRYSHSKYYWFIIGCYILAKVFEAADQTILDTISIISGHSIKHLISSLSPLLFYIALKNREPIECSANRK